jgi:hypothetical protein
LVKKPNRNLWQESFCISLVRKESSQSDLKPVVHHCNPLDIHVDPNYLAGSSPKKYCHRKSNKSKKNTAGKFGALHTDCDSPIALVSL